jgi:mannonate dehydratase
VCYCTGSLGAGAENDLPAIARTHRQTNSLRAPANVKRDPQGNFFEDDHLAGDVDMYAVMKEILTIQQSCPSPSRSGPTTATR